MSFLVKIKYYYKDVFLYIFIKIETSVSGNIAEKTHTWKQDSSIHKPYLFGQWSFIRGVVRGFFFYQLLITKTTAEDLVSENGFKRSLVLHLVWSSTDQKDRAYESMNLYSNTLF